MTFSNEAKIGLAVFGAVVVFVAGVMFLRGINLQTREYSLTILYKNVNGLQDGSPITVAGLRIGQVESMTLTGKAIAVKVSIQKKVQLPSDSRAIIKSESIMGGKYIEITPGSDNVMLKNHDTIAGAYEADLTELTATLAPISSNVLGILENVNATFDEKTRADIKNTVADISRSSAELQRLIHAEGKRLDYAIGNFATFSDNLSHFALNLDSIALSQRTNLDSSMATLRRVATTLDRVTIDMQSTTESLNVILGKMRKGEGTLGRLIHDEHLYDNLDSLSVNLNLLVRDVRENPGRYVRISLF
jgi:phospholipid/cholesterol/gamma-HCH transport system substrate-binding protein